MLRNQGQVLGEERDGDRLVVEGESVDGRVVASAVRVVPDARRRRRAGGRRADAPVRERAPGGRRHRHGDPSRSPTGVVVDIPSVPGANDVNQLRHHLDVQRMSKSRGNVIDPDDLVRAVRRRHGAHLSDVRLRMAEGWSVGQPRHHRLPPVHRGRLEAGHRRLRRRPSTRTPSRSSSARSTRRSSRWVRTSSR